MKILPFHKGAIIINIPGLIMAITLLAMSPEIYAEYGDVVLNKRAENEGVRPVVFSHWFHRIRFRCNVCHSELKFEMRAGANQVTMDEITDGKFCGACHNGDIAWSTENCDLCHSGNAGISSGIYGGHQTGGPGRW
jgi:c(7)-type cytochrome triheme protein